MEIDLLKQRPMDPQERGKVIQKRLKEINREQQWLADRIGITPKKLSEYLTGKIKTIPDKVMETLYKDEKLNLKKEDFIVFEVPTLSYDEVQSGHVLQMLELLEFVKAHRDEPWLLSDCKFGFDEFVRYDLENLFARFLIYKDETRKPGI